MNLHSLKQPKLLALGIPIALLGQCAPQSCAPVPAAPAATTVSGVVDGDTVDLSNGERVRLIGIDAPEVGTCGADLATAALSSIVLHKPVTVTSGAVDDRDRYGRLLRYIESAGIDAGRHLLSAGYAIARYDSRDGYGAYPREPDYISADAASPSSPTCSTTTPPPAGNCERSYPTLCLTSGVDVDCGEIPQHKNFTVLPPDPFRLDGNDNDGVGCES